MPLGSAAHIDYQLKSAGGPVTYGNQSGYGILDSPALNVTDSTGLNIRGYDRVLVVREGAFTGLKEDQPITYGGLAFTIGDIGTAGADGLRRLEVTRAIAVESLTISPSAIFLAAGETVQLTGTARDVQGNVLAGRAVTWSTSDPSIATVSATGLVTAVALGSFTITATSEFVSAAVDGAIVVPLSPDFEHWLVEDGNFPRRAPAGIYFYPRHGQGIQFDEGNGVIRRLGYAYPTGNNPAEVATGKNQFIVAGPGGGVWTDSGNVGAAPSALILPTQPLSYRRFTVNADPNGWSISIRHDLIPSEMGVLDNPCFISAREFVKGTVGDQYQIGIGHYNAHNFDIVAAVTVTLTAVEQEFDFSGLYTFTAGELASGIQMSVEIHPVGHPAIGHVIDIANSGIIVGEQRELKNQVLPIHPSPYVDTPAGLAIHKTRGLRIANPAQNHLASPDDVGQSGAGQLASDTFTRADGSSLGTDDTGQAWIALSGTWGISGNRAALIADGGSNKNAAVIDSGVSDCTVQATFVVAGDEQRLVWRATDADNLFILQTLGGVLFIYRRQAGSYNAVTTSPASPSYTPVNGDVVSVVLSGSSITVKVNGTTIATATDSFQLSATKHGIGTNLSTTLRWDNFSVSVVSQWSNSNVAVTNTATLGPDGRLVPASHPGRFWKQIVWQSNGLQTLSAITLPQDQVGQPGGDSPAGTAKGKRVRMHFYWQKDGANALPVAGDLRFEMDDSVGTKTGLLTNIRPDETNPNLVTAHAEITIDVNNTATSFPARLRNVSGHVLQYQEARRAIEREAWLSSNTRNFVPPDAMVTPQRWPVTHEGVGTLIQDMTQHRVETPSLFLDLAGGAMPFRYYRDGSWNLADLVGRPSIQRKLCDSGPQATSFASFIQSFVTDVSGNLFYSSYISDSPNVGGVSHILEFPVPLNALVAAGIDDICPIWSQGRVTDVYINRVWYRNISGTWYSDVNGVLTPLVGVVDTYTPGTLWTVGPTFYYLMDRDFDCGYSAWLRAKAAKKTIVPLRDSVAQYYAHLDANGVGMAA